MYILKNIKILTIFYIYANASIIAVVFSENQEEYDNITKLTRFSNSTFQILISWQPDGVNLYNFDIIDLAEFWVGPRE